MSSVIKDTKRCTDCRSLKYEYVDCVCEKKTCEDCDKFIFRYKVCTCTCDDLCECNTDYICKCLRPPPKTCMFCDKLRFNFIDDSCTCSKAFCDDCNKFSFEHKTCVCRIDICRCNDEFVCNCLWNDFKRMRKNCKCGASRAYDEDYDGYYGGGYMSGNPLGY